MRNWSIAGIGSGSDSASGLGINATTHLLPLNLQVCVSGLNYGGFIFTSSSRSKYSPEVKGSF